MFKRFISLAQFTFIVLLFIGTALETRADSSAKSAFLFAERKNWSEALAHSKRSSEQGLHDLILWLAILDSDSNVPAATIYDFLQKHPQWPEIRRVQVRFEQAIVNEGMNITRHAEWFKVHPPIAGAGKLIKATTLLTDKQRTKEVQQLLQEAWTEGDFTPDIEQEFLRRYGKMLDTTTHQARADRLVWEKKYSAAKRLYPQISKGHQQLIEARIALENTEKNAPALLAKVPQAYQQNAGLLYSRLLWRHAKRDASGAIELLMAAPKTNLPYADKWWDLRETYIRQAIDAKKYSLAAKLLKGHGLKEGKDFAEAAWLKGWILLEFQNNAADAYVAFDTLYQGVNFAVSKARAAYWAGKAAEKLGQKEVAADWFKTATKYPTTFYGQLAHHKILTPAALVLPSSPPLNSTSYKSFKSSSIAKALLICMKYDRLDVAGRLIRALMDNAENPEDMLNIALLAKEYHSTALGVKAAKRALQYNVMLRDTAYPTLDSVPDSLEAALTHAIIRQESEFDKHAKSPAGALGYMQLLPSTAREVAQKLGLNPKHIQLTHGTTNVKLGSAYLARLIAKFDGSYVLAIASYNAGPGRVRQWVNEFGHPGKSIDEIINWIEKIPYSETRNYVQRVLENVQVYRVILGGAKGTALRLEQDLKR